MNAAITLLIAIAVIILHVWLCRRSPKFWYLGGIIPLLWTALLVFLFFSGKINWGEDWKMTVFPTLIFSCFGFKDIRWQRKKKLQK